jgi:sulfur relay (sulfurtransferase) complex TusBCD TusD component (DsrE family)
MGDRARESARAGGHTLAILLCHGPDSADARRAARLVAAALDRGITPRLFLMADGVHNVDRGPLAEWVGQVDITLCAVNAEAAGTARRDGVRFGSQHDHMVLVTSSDRVVAFA